MSFYKLLKKDAVTETTKEHVKALEVIKKDLMEATNITLRLPKPGLQNVILFDASYHRAGFVLMVEDYVNETGEKKKKTYAPVSFGTHLFNATQLKFSIYYLHFCIIRWTTFGTTFGDQANRYAYSLTTKALHNFLTKSNTAISLELFRQNTCL